MGGGYEKVRSVDLLFFVVLLGTTVAANAQTKSTIAIEHVTVIDGTGRPAIPDATVIIEGDRITRVSRRIPIPTGAQRIDGRGKYLIPGMMDVHIHLHGGFSKPPDERAGVRALQSYLYCGVTTVLDVGNNPDFIFGLRGKERAGQIVSTRLLATGGIVTYPGSHGSDPNMSTLVDSWPQAIPALDKALVSSGLFEARLRRRRLGDAAIDPAAAHSSDAARHRVLQ